MIKLNTNFYSFYSFYSFFSTLSAPAPVVVYPNAAAHKASIIKNNNRKPGIYRWVNLINGNTYIGSSLNLGNRLRDYFKHSFLIHPKNNKLLIYKAILKYGYSNFQLEILEYCDVSLLISREQYFIDTFKPSYNILTVASSSFGFKHTEESLSKLRSHLLLINLEKAFKVHVTDIVTNTKTVYDSIRKAALALNTDLKALKYHESKKSPKKPFKGRYIINILRL